MRRSGMITITLITICAVLESARAGDDDFIKYRQHVMKAMGEEAYAIDQIYEHKIPADSLSRHLQALAMTTATAKMAFEPKVLGGKSKSTVWAQWPDFSDRLDQLANITADLAATVTTPDDPKLQREEVEESRCKVCHDQYRLPYQ